MTRQIRANERTNQTRHASAHTVKCTNTQVRGTAVRTDVGTRLIKGAETVSCLYKKAIRVRNNISDRFVAYTETLADKIAREGLFGEDKGKNYCGTDVDYISD